MKKILSVLLVLVASTALAVQSMSFTNVSAATIAADVARWVAASEAAVGA